MTNEWIDWSDSRCRMPTMRGGTSAVATAAAATAATTASNQFQFNYSTVAAAAAAVSAAVSNAPTAGTTAFTAASASATRLGLMKVHSVMKSLQQRPKGIAPRAKLDSSVEML